MNSCLFPHAKCKLLSLGRQSIWTMEEIADHEEEAYSNERGADHGGGLKASRDRVRPTVIEAVNERRCRQPDERHQNAADKLDASRP